MLSSSQQAQTAPTYDLLGVEISILTIPDAVRRILDAVEQGRKGYVCVTGMHGIMEARDDASFQHLLNHSFLCTPDGMPTVWIGQAKGHTMDRVYGPDLMLAVLKATQHKPIRHFFYGGAPGVADNLKRIVEKRFPGIQITGTFCPPFRPLNNTEKSELLKRVERSGADIFWVGLSTPKQERFMAEYLPQLPVKIMLGVGAAFDFHTGRIKQAPRWMMRAGLEWLFRLLTEPRRLWRRYCFLVPRFGALLLLDALGLVSHHSDDPETPRGFAAVAKWPRRILLGFVFLCVLTFVSWATGLCCLREMAMAYFPSLLITISVLLLTTRASEVARRLDTPLTQVFLLTGQCASFGALWGPPIIFALSLLFPFTSFHLGLF